LREQIRQAVLSGEFGERLPGERELGRRYHANAKTINKALSDLSSDGLLVRHIGRGTYIAAAESTQVTGTRTRAFQCLVAAHPLGGHRDQLLDLIRQRMSARGHNFSCSNIESDRQDVPLSAWPAASRRATDGVLCYPPSPLSDGVGRLSTECVAELHRRHVPAVVIGATCTDAKLNSVVPDYSDAGFRLAEYLFNAGCTTAGFVASENGSREVELAWNAFQAAAVRHGRECFRVNLSEEPFPNEISQIERRASSANDGQRLGLVCVGSPALRHVSKAADLTTRRSNGALLLTAAVEPGDPAAREAGVTSYDVDMSRMADWVVRLMIESRPGQKPVDIIVPGLVRVRETPENGAQSAPSSAECVLADATV
jgi:DNA-binding LacI/PurR family transcriptional regulator